MKRALISAVLPVDPEIRRTGRLGKTCAVSAAYAALNKNTVATAANPAK
jgi:hypothetical protein